MALNPVAIQPLASAGDDVNNTVLALRTLGNFDFQGTLNLGSPSTILTCL